MVYLGVQEGSRTLQAGPDPAPCTSTTKPLTIESYTLLRRHAQELRSLCKLPSSAGRRGLSFGSMLQTACKKADECFPSCSSSALVKHGFSIDRALVPINGRRATHTTPTTPRQQAVAGTQETLNGVLACVASQHDATLKHESASKRSCPIRDAPMEFLTTIPKTSWDAHEKLEAPNLRHHIITIRIVVGTLVDIITISITIIIVATNIIIMATFIITTTTITTIITITTITITTITTTIITITTIIIIIIIIAIMHQP